MRHAPTTATRAAAFPADEPVDERGLAAAALLSERGEAICSPALRCRQTAAAMGLAFVLVEPALAECDFGAWAGRSLTDIDEEEAGAWMADPDACPHGGESLSVFAARVAGWLDGQARLDGRAVAITHGGVVKAAAALALGAPLRAFWQIDAAPLAITELHAHDGRWTVTRMNCVSNPRRDATSIRHSCAGATA